MYLTTHLPALHEALQGGVRVDLIAFCTPVRAECNYKMRIERKIGDNGQTDADYLAEPHNFMLVVGDFAQVPVDPAEN